MNVHFFYFVDGNVFRGFKIKTCARLCGLWMGVLGALFLVGFWAGPKAWAESAENTAIAESIKFENPEIKMEANQITMDTDRNLIEARGQVRLLVKESGVRFETEALDYSLGARVVTIPGQVRFIAESAEFVVDTFTYNLQTQEGQGGALEGTLVDSPRSVMLEGQQLETVDGGQTISIGGASFTRCAKPKPDYVFKASKVVVTKDRVRLTHILLYFKGIPIFYFPSLSLKTKDKSNYPEIETKLRYGPNQEWALDYALGFPINDQSDFLVKGSASQGEDSNLGVGYSFEVGGLSNKSYLIKYFERDWVVEDELRFVVGGVATNLSASYDFGSQKTDLRGLLTKDFGTLLLTADGLYDSTGNRHELGFNLTRKYGAGWLDDWQFGVQARRVEKAGNIGTNGENYGIYGGYRVDYRPIQYLTLSYLRLDSFTDYEYTGFSPNLGSSALYQVNVPIGKGFSLTMGGTYNLTEQNWKSQTYGFTYDTCCYAINCQWDAVSDDWRSISLGFKF